MLEAVPDLYPQLGWNSPNWPLRPMSTTDEPQKKKGATEVPGEERLD